MPVARSSSTSQGALLPQPATAPLHGGPDALGVPVHDLSSNANACGACPTARHALARADARHYPDPAYTALVHALAGWHGVAPERIVIAASASEFIQRISTAVRLRAAADGAGVPAVWQPAHAYGDYARAAQAAGLHPVADPGAAALLWSCEPSSPLGRADAGLAARVAALQPGQVLVLDQAYEPLRLAGAPSLDAAALERVWRLVTPNKALGLTGVRAAYAIAPRAPDPALLQRLRLLAPSWPLGAHGVALLQAWTTDEAQAWLAACRPRLRRWKARQAEHLHAAGWQVLPGDANFLVARPAGSAPMAERAAALQTLLVRLRQRGVKLRDCTSFGLAGWARLAVAPPATQDALAAALKALA
ncbi:MAG TPA: aminotransferase class I/II-fold pyridoxal phosphate-dependent enzyme [Ottowia sp.]|uniref:aminotransferase class I/II-fold pyridoxal phosphate-dependent enzyme n=1 Tax=Ottowia sp. TaxID=1898956 RepID=UPI002B6BDC76|nr:aminotransferase class I/II-fold pyridoxal phosphate-dependent enzyme [Ottowia sp.]HMN21955.1 aminotransferase class I/II-fold pyridoxal phosphate-dependent enzyme [Ottowia sp.]